MALRNAGAKLRGTHRHSTLEFQCLLHHHFNAVLNRLLLIFFMWVVHNSLVEVPISNMAQYRVEKTQFARAFLGLIYGDQT